MATIIARTTTNSTTRVRSLTIVFVLALAGALAGQGRRAVTPGTLRSEE